MQLNACHVCTCHSLSFIKWEGTLTFILIELSILCTRFSVIWVTILPRPPQTCVFLSMYSVDKVAGFLRYSHISEAAVIKLNIYT